MKAERLCIMVCDCFRQEISALARELDHPEVEFLTFPARCARSSLQWEDLSELIPAPGDFQKIILFGNCCLDHLGTPPDTLAHLQLTRLTHCFSLLAGDYLISQYQRQGGYLVSSGWLGEWEERLAPSGSDPEATGEFFRESTAGIIHLDTGVLETAPDLLEAFARFVDRPQQTVPVGLEFLKLRIEKIIGDWLNERQLAEQRRLLQKSRRKSADYAMALDLLRLIVRATGKRELVREILQLYVMMFGAKELAYVPIVDGRPGMITRIGSDWGCDDQALQGEALLLDTDYRLLPSGAGFLLRVVHEGRMLGMILIEGVASPQNLDEYLHLALDTVVVCAVVLDNARTFERVLAISHRLKQSEEALDLSNRQLEQRVQARTAELEAALHEQASFSYSVSHDLRAPLRHINSFSSLLMEESGKDLPERARDYLERICQSTRTMGELIDSLLELSRVSRTATTTREVNLSECATQIAQRLQEGGGHKPQFRIEEGLTVSGDAPLLRQMLENLLGNAWKFTSRTTSPCIEFGGTSVDGKQLFFVKDNGVGFDMSYSSKLFEVFERLHGNEFEGTGIGLATVQRIVQRHGGSIRAEAGVDQGATFYFTLSGLPEPASLPETPVEPAKIVPVPPMPIVQGVRMDYRLSAPGDGFR